MENAYIRKVQYHETDRMGITHHSNYIKWMEEARIDFLDKVGYSYARLEAEGILSPVIGVECSYKHPTTFDDTVRIVVGVEAFKGGAADHPLRDDQCRHRGSGADRPHHALLHRRDRPSHPAEEEMPRSGGAV